MSDTKKIVVLLAFFVLGMVAAALGDRPPCDAQSYMMSKKERQVLAIVNVSEKHGIPYGKGKQKYELRLNYKVLAEVEHTFEDRAAVLLRKAADALEKAESPGPQKGPSSVAKVNAESKVVAKELIER